MRAAIAALFIVLLPSSARAEAPAAPTAYAAGDFLQAAIAGEQDGRADGLTLAAQALLAKCVLDPRDAGVAAMLDRAEKDAAAALALDNSAPGPRLQLALALGLKARRTSLREAIRANYAPRGRRLIEEAIDLDPRQAWAYAMLGGWHLEVLRRGGVLGGKIMGATYRAGLRAFERARTLAPDNPAISLHYAVALLALDPDKHAAQAAVLLQAAAAAPARDAFETFMREEARRIGAVLASRGPQAAAHSAADAFL
jgi:hypothetical protein